MNNLTTTTEKLPHRFRESEFRRYEPHILRIVQLYPAMTVYRTSPLSTTTFACRLRDAMSSFVKYSWPSPIDHTRFVEIRKDLVVREHDGHVYVGPKELSIPVAPGEQISHSEAEDVLTLDSPTLAVLHAVCLLQSNRILLNCVRVNHLPSGINVRELENLYDIAITVHPDHIIII